MRNFDNSYGISMMLVPLGHLPGIDDARRTYASCDSDTVYIREGVAHLSCTVNNAQRAQKSEANDRGVFVVVLV